MRAIVHNRKREGNGSSPASTAGVEAVSGRVLLIRVLGLCILRSFRQSKYRPFSRKVFNNRPSRDLLGDVL